MSNLKAFFAALILTFIGSKTRILFAEETVSKTPPPANTKASPANQEQTDARKLIKPKELSESVKKGLEYLVSQQDENGGFGQGGGWRTSNHGASGRIEGKDVKDPPDVGNTAVAALALIRAGNSPKEGKYSKQLVKAIEFIETHIESADKDSLYVTPIHDTQLQSKIGQYVDTFLAALVLSELKGQMPDNTMESRLLAALNKTIRKIEANQQADGTFAGNSGWASVLSQGLCSKALSRASQKGVLVKAETIKRDLDQTVAQLSNVELTGEVSVKAGVITSAKPGASALGGLSGLARRSPFGSSMKGDAGVQLYSLAANGSRVQDTVNANQIRKLKVNEVINSSTADAKAKETAQLELKEIAEAEKANGEATTQIVANLSDARFVRGFGNNGGEEFLSYMNISETLLAQGGEAWEKWDRQATETITKIQNQDGSWSGHHCITGRTFCTATALLTLMADRAPLPPLTETKSEAK